MLISATSYLLALALLTLLTYTSCKPATDVAIRTAASKSDIGGVDGILLGTSIEQAKQLPGYLPSPPDLATTLGKDETRDIAGLKVWGGTLLSFEAGKLVHITLLLETKDESVAALVANALTRDFKKEYSKSLFQQATDMPLFKNYASLKDAEGDTISLSVTEETVMLNIDRGR